MITADKLLAKLPPFRDEWVLVKQDHKVNDIIRQILTAHEKYAEYYDKIALSFDGKTIDEICKNLYDFCKREIAYSEEKEQDQTTALPQGILTRKEGDCKHYANFCGGVLDAITRLTGKKINWCYRFASYNLVSKTPHHVFIVVKDKGGEIWLDPVPGSENMQPFWQIDKKVKINSMPIYDNIGSFNNSESDYYGGRNEQLGFIDPVSAVTIGENVFNFLSKFGDKVPDYPVKSVNTLNSLIASIDSMIPLPPKDVADAKRILAIAYDERAKSVARGTDRATLTAIMLTDERITALQNYINSGGGVFSLPKAGSGSSAPLPAGQPPLVPTGAKGISPIILLGAAGVGLYFLTRKGKAVTGMDNTTLLLLGAGAYLVYKNRNKQPAAVTGVPEHPIVTEPEFAAPSV